MNQTINTDEIQERKKRWKEFAKLIDKIGSNNVTDQSAVRSSLFS
ncbi:hypothetical protein [Saccharobesus litoralis]|nr:hypothetical protein [Saccharobesus litoralis]